MEGAMKTNESFVRAAGIISIVMGILYLAVGTNYLFMPQAQQEYLRPEFWQSFAQQPISGYVQSIAFALIAFLALGLMPIVTTIAGGTITRFLRWMMVLGMLGYVVHAVEELRTMVLATRIADAYVEGDSATRTAIVALGLQHLDPLHIFKFGLVGLWVLVVDLVGLVKKTFPTVLAIVGILGAAAFWTNLVGNVLQAVSLVTVASISAIILGPIWFIWMGFFIRKNADSLDPG
jgi:hypothetical protein